MLTAYQVKLPRTKFYAMDSVDDSDGLDSLRTLANKLDSPEDKTIPIVLGKGSGICTLQF
jgi:hypothetical protein